MRAWIVTLSLLAAAPVAAQAQRSVCATPAERCPTRNLPGDPCRCPSDPRAWGQVVQYDDRRMDLYRLPPPPPQQHLSNDDLYDDDDVLAGPRRHRRPPGTQDDDTLSR